LIATADFTQSRMRKMGIGWKSSDVRAE